MTNNDPKESVDQPPFEVPARIKRLPPYLFGRINALKHRLRQEGKDVIDLGMGNPADAPPKMILDKLTEAVQDPRNHRYSVSNGLFNLRRELAHKYERRWNVGLDPETEIIACLGSKEGFSHSCLALMGPGDTAVVGDPAFPIHVYAPALAGANVISVPLGNDHEFLERVETIFDRLFPRPKVLILNYPHNPTALTVEPGFFEEVVALAKKYQFLVFHDFAYGETCFDGYQAPSFLSAPGAKDVGVEFSTLSKAYNMAGWRIGFCAGRREIIQALATVKGYYDYGIFQPIQIASIIALRECDDFIPRQAAVYQQRRDVLLAGLDRIGWQPEPPRASMFVWTRIPDEHLKGLGTIDYSLKLLEEAEVAVAPGRAFGECGEGYARIALVENEHRLRQAIRHLDRFIHGKTKKRTRVTKKSRALRAD